MKKCEKIYKIYKKYKNKKYTISKLNTSKSHGVKNIYTR